MVVCRPTMSSNLAASRRSSSSSSVAAAAAKRPAVGEGGGGGGKAAAGAAAAKKRVALSNISNVAAAAGGGGGGGPPGKAGNAVRDGSLVEGLGSLLFFLFYFLEGFVLCAVWVEIFRSVLWLEWFLGGLLCFFCFWWFLLGSWDGSSSLFCSSWIGGILDSEIAKAICI